MDLKVNSGPPPSPHKLFDHAPPPPPPSPPPPSPPPPRSPFFPSASFSSPPSPAPSPLHLHRRAPSRPVRERRQRPPRVHPSSPDFIDLIQGILELLAGIKILQLVVSNRRNIDWELLIQKIKRKKPEYIINPLRIQHNEFYHFTTSLSRRGHRALKNGR